MRSERGRGFALLLITLIVLLPVAGSEAATKKKRKPAPRRKGRVTRRAPAAPVETATGGATSRRVQSLMNGRVAGSSEASLQVVDVDSGDVVAERSPHTPLAPASNMKLFTTAAAID